MNSQVKSRHFVAVRFLFDIILIFSTMSQVPTQIFDSMDATLDMDHPSEQLNLKMEDPLAATNGFHTQAAMRQLTLDEAHIKPEDTFTILLASDCHLGYADRDELRKNDSLRSFEEILRTAKEKQVDFVLLGGDLFHENKPSRSTAQQCASLLRSYCMGDGQVKFQLVSEPEVNFSHVEPQFRRANTEDPDLNVNLPVYSIHGNHDDPSGLKYLSELDLLHTYGLINYFGKANDIENIDIYPLLFTKGQTKLALYGLGSIRDERLHRAYLNNRVQMKRPSENTDEWFNLFVLHQNRPAHRGSHNYIPESFLDSFLDLVVWGHEHDPIPEPEHNKERGFEVLQPGSSVATSMSDGEGKQKFCYLVKICGRKYRVEPIALQTIRPFVIEEIDLKQAGFTKTEANVDTIRAEVETFLAGRMERIIRRVEETKGPNQPKQPLVRLRVDFGDIEPLNPILFGQKFFSRVANPKDIILPLKRKAESKGQTNGHGHVGNGTMKDVKPLIELDASTIEDVLVKYFDDKSDSGLMVFNSKFLTEALRKFVNNEDKDAISDAYEYQKAQALQYLSLAEMSGDPGEELLTNLRTFRAENEKYMSDFVNDFEDWRSQGAGKKKGAATRAQPKPAPVIVQIDVSDEEMPSVTTNGTSGGRARGTSSRARGSRARGARAARGGAAGRAGYASSPEIEIPSASSSATKTPTSTARGTPRGRATRARGARAARK